MAFELFQDPRVYIDLNTSDSIYSLYSFITVGITSFSRDKSFIASKAVSNESAVPKKPSFLAFRMLKESGQSPRRAESDIPNI